MFNLSILLEDSARNHPARDALVLGDTRLTYAQVNGAATQVANLLVERGIKPGDKVALSCPNLPYFAGWPGASQPPAPTDPVMWNST